MHYGSKGVQVVLAILPANNYFSSWTRPPLGGLKVQNLPPGFNTSSNCSAMIPLSQRCLHNAEVHFRIYCHKCVFHPSNKFPRKTTAKGKEILVGDAMMFEVDRSCTMVNFFVGDCDARRRLLQILEVREL